MLTEAQQRYFNACGFLVLRRCLSPAEVALLREEHAAALEEDRGGRAVTVERQHWAAGAIERRERLRWLAEDDRLYVPLEQLLGPGFVWLVSAAIMYKGDTGWHIDGSGSHPDGAHLDYPRIKVGIYLDPVTASTGALRVIPGSHFMPINELLAPLMYERGAGGSPAFGVPPEEIPAAALETEPGDVVLLNHCVWHASFRGALRREITFRVAGRPASAEDIRHLEWEYRFNLANMRELGLTDRGRLYDDAFMGSNSERVRSLLAAARELGHL